MRTISVTLLALFGASTIARVARADETSPRERRFGDAGQLVVTADRLVPLFSHTTQTITSEQGETTTRVTDSGASFAFLVGREPGLASVHTVPRVALDVSVARGLTLGGSFVFALGVSGAHVEERTQSGGAPTIRENRPEAPTMLGFAPRVGYVVRLTRALAIWPRASTSFTSVTSSREQTSDLGVTSSASETNALFALSLDAPLVWTPLPYVLVHAGPVVDVPLTGSHETAFVQEGVSKERSDDLSVFHVGASLSLGLWFDL